MGDPCISRTEASRVRNRYQCLNCNADEIQEAMDYAEGKKKKKTLKDPHFWKGSYNFMSFTTMKTTRFSW